MKYKYFEVNPMAKPRMTQRDKWLKPPRPAVARYRQFQLIIAAQNNGFVMPESNYHIIFHLPMPKSWSEKKKVKMNLQPHRTKPDKDNLEKAVLDTLCSGSDAHIWDGRVTKRWAREGKIIIIY